MSKSSRIALVVAALGSLACSDDYAVDVPFEPVPAPAVVPNLPVLGLGEVPERITAELWVRGDYAYTSTWGRRGTNVGNAVKIWRVSGDVPVLLDSLIVSQATTIGDVEVSDDGTIMVIPTEHSPGSIVIFDMSNPAKPVQISRLQTANMQPGVHTAEVERVNGKLYAFLSIDGIDNLVIVDLSDPYNPREVFVERVTFSTIHDVFVRDGYLFTALWDDGMVIWDIGGGGKGSPERPFKMGVASTVGGNVHNIWWFHDPTTGSRKYAFVGEEQPSRAGDIHVVDVTDFNNPREVAYYSMAGEGTHNFSVDEQSGVLYAAYYEGGVVALDIRGDLGSCAQSQRSPDGRCDLERMGRVKAFALRNTGRANLSIWGVHWQGNYLYASDMQNGIWKVNVSSLRR